MMETIRVSNNACLDDAPGVSISGMNLVSSVPYALRDRILVSSAAPHLRPHVSLKPENTCACTGKLVPADFDQF